jgi:hypothetical protein
MPEFQTDASGDAIRLSQLVAETDDVEPPDEPEMTGTCCICGADGPVYKLTGTNGVFSNNFNDQNHIGPSETPCWRCKYLAETHEYRRYHWIATESDGLQTTKDREEVLEALLNPPEGRWMIRVADDMTRIPNSWIRAQRLNTSQQQFRVLYDSEMIHVDADEFADMVALGRRLRADDRDSQVAKGVLQTGPSYGDAPRFDLSRDDVAEIESYVGEPMWELAVTLIQ